MISSITVKLSEGKEVIIEGCNLNEYMTLKLLELCAVKEYAVKKENESGFPGIPSVFPEDSISVKSKTLYRKATANFKITEWADYKGNTFNKVDVPQGAYLALFFRNDYLVSVTVINPYWKTQVMLGDFHVDTRLDYIDKNTMDITEDEYLKNTDGITQAE